MSIVISEPDKRSNPYLDRITLVRGDITAQDVEAVMTIMPYTLEFQGRLNIALIEGGGAQMDSFILDNIYKPRPGDVYNVPGFDLAAQQLLICIIPLWKDDFARENKHVTNAVRKALEAARDQGIKTLAIPPIGSGKNGFPKPRAARLIVQGILDRLDNSIEEVRIVCPDEAVEGAFKERLQAVGWRA